MLVLKYFYSVSSVNEKKFEIIDVLSILKEDIAAPEDIAAFKHYKLKWRLWLDLEVFANPSNTEISAEKEGIYTILLV